MRPLQFEDDRFKVREVRDILKYMENDPKASPFVGLSVMQIRRYYEGGQSLIFHNSDDENCPAMAFGTLCRGRLNSNLLVTLFCPNPAEDYFGEFLSRFASSNFVGEATVEAFGIDRPVVPALPSETIRYQNACTYMVPLEYVNLTAHFSRNHLRNIGSAKKYGTRLVEISTPEAIETHLRLVDASVQRRVHRGEKSWKNTNFQRIKKLLSNGNARLYQAGFQSTVLSSKLIFTLGHYGYYHTGGTSPEGMRCGASYFLMSEIILDLKRRGFQRLNLDVASPTNPGLRRYKKGFGTDEIPLERATYNFKNTKTNIGNFALSLRRII